MKLGTKLRICRVLSVLALVFEIIVFVSPGWVVVMKDIYVEPIESVTDGITPQHHGIRTTMQPDDLSLSPTRKHVSISFGVWYYKVCMCDKGDDNNGSSEEKHHDKKQHGNDKCFHGSYRKEKPHDDNGHVMEDRDDNIPPEFRPAREFITTSIGKYSFYIKTSKGIHYLLRLLVSSHSIYRPARGFITTSVGKYSFYTVFRQAREYITMFLGKCLLYI